MTDPVVRDATNAVLRKYSPHKLQMKADEYTYRHEWSPEDCNAWRAFRKRGYMTTDDLEKVAVWKTGTGRSLPKVRQNNSATVRYFTSLAIKADRLLPEAPMIPVLALTALHGVAIPTASTIMTIWDPARYAIIDINAWKALSRAAKKSFREIEASSVLTARDVDLYFRVVRELSKQARLSCRQIDQALWTLGANS